MIKRLVFGFGPPKCGQDTTGRELQKSHGWRHVSMRRSLLRLDETYPEFEIKDSLHAGKLIADDLILLAISLSIAGSARWDKDRSVFFQGFLFGPLIIRRALEHASHYSRSIEVVEFVLPEAEACQRMVKTDDPKFLNRPESAKSAFSAYAESATAFRKAVRVVLTTSHKGMSYRGIDAAVPTDHVIRQIIKPQAMALT